MKRASTRIAPPSRPAERVAPAAPALAARTAFPLRREGPAKLTGEARYADDLVFAGAWYGATIRSDDPHATLIAIDRDPDFDWSRVLIVTADEIPGENVVSLISDDQPVLVPVGGEIRHHAEPVALLAAADRSTLHAAKRRIQLRTERLPAVFDPLASTQQIAHFAIRRGDAEKGLADAELIVEGEYRVGHQEQLYIENQAMIALPRDDGGITVHGSLQCPYYIHKAMKRALNLTDAQAVVIQSETGGGFGGKEEYPSMIALHAALLARKLPAIVRHRTGVTRDGELVAQEIEVVMDGGAYATLTPVVLSRGTIHAGGPYRCENVTITGRAMATNTPPNGAFRGFGAPQTEFAAEMQVNRIAEALDVSPLELRRRWAYREGDVTPTGQVLRESVAALEVLEAAAETAGFSRKRTDRRRASTSGGTRASGIGLALAWHGAGFTGAGETHLASVASIQLTDVGAIRVLTASTEMGQGTKTIFPQLVAAELGIGIDEVEMAPQDTSLVPDSGPTVASRTAMVVGRILIGAARKLRARVEESSGQPFPRSYRDFAKRTGGIRIDERFEPYPGITFDEERYVGDAYPCYGWAAAVAEVEVDLDTGEVAVESVVSADDVGRVIHPVLAEGQVEGGTLQAVGYATMEEIKLADGRYLNDRLATYLIPTALDAPRITSILVEKPFSGSPHGAKGVGELPMDVAAPAVVAAIHDAVGVWIHELPATPERILAALSGASTPDTPGFEPGTRSGARANRAAPARGVDPRPEAPSDPLPLRAPQDKGGDWERDR